MRHRAQKWNVGLERRKERETFCGRLRKRTPFLRWRAQLQGCEAERQKLRMSSRCEVILLRRHSPFIFHIKLCKIAIDFTVYCLFYWSVIRCQD